MYMQAYVIPDHDVRYLTTFGGVEGACILTQSRRYSDRFSAASSQAAAAAAAASTIQQAAAAAATAVMKAQQQLQHAPAGVAGDHASHNSSMISLSQDSGLPADAGSPGLTSLQAAATADDAAPYKLQLSSGSGCTDTEVLLQTAPSLSQETCETPTLPAGASWKHAAAHSVSIAGLSHSSVIGAALHVPSGSSSMAVGTVGASPTECSAADGASLNGCDAEGAAATETLKSAPSMVSKAAAAAVQVLNSYLDKAHGLRVTGLAAEVRCWPTMLLLLLWVIQGSSCPPT